MKKLPLEIKDIADKINNKQGNLHELQYQLKTLVSNYNFLYKNYNGTKSTCVVERFAGLLEPTFYSDDADEWFL